MKKKVGLSLLGAIIVVLFIFSCYTMGYIKQYSIKDNAKQLEDSIKERTELQTIEIKDSINIDNKKYVLFRTNNLLGEAEFTKGYNNKYKIGSTGYGSNPIRSFIYKTNNSKCLIILGENFDLEINCVKIMLDNKEYKINVPKQEYFMVYCIVPEKTQGSRPDLSDFKFYDENNVDITNKVFSHF